MAKCSGITRAGTACKGTPIEGSQWCYVHHPDHAEERRRHGSRGGKRGGRGRPQAELSDIKDRLRAMVEDVRTGVMDRPALLLVPLITITSMCPPRTWAKPSLETTLRD